VIRLMGQLAKLPISAFVRGIELFLDALRDFQGLAEQGIDTLAGVPPAVDPQEVRGMADQDLGGDDLKYVSYSIVFTKRDLEAPLQKERQEVINYATDGGSFAALKMGDFQVKLERGEISRPAVWADNKYPQDDGSEFITGIPSEDRKYIRFVYRVDQRLPRQERDYEKEQVKVLREIRDRL
jgi:hypothetical protein